MFGPQSGIGMELGVGKDEKLCSGYQDLFQLRYEGHLSSPTTNFLKETLFGLFNNTIFENLMLHEYVDRDTVADTHKCKFLEHCNAEVGRQKCYDSHEKIKKMRTKTKEIIVCFESYGSDSERYGEDYENLGKLESDTDYQTVVSIVEFENVPLLADFRLNITQKQINGGDVMSTALTFVLTLRYSKTTPPWKMNRVHHAAAKDTIALFSTPDFRNRASAP